MPSSISFQDFAKQYKKQPVKQSFNEFAKQQTPTTATLISKPLVLKPFKTVLTPLIEPLVPTGNLA